MLSSLSLCGQPFFLTIHHVRSQKLKSWCFCQHSFCKCVHIDCTFSECFFCCGYLLCLNLVKCNFLLVTFEVYHMFYIFLSILFMFRSALWLVNTCDLQLQYMSYSLAYKMYALLSGLQMHLLFLFFLFSFLQSKSCVIFLPRYVHLHTFSI